MPHTSPSIVPDARSTTESHLALTLRRKLGAAEAAARPGAATSGSGIDVVFLPEDDRDWLELGLDHDPR